MDAESKEARSTEVVLRMISEENQKMQRYIVKGVVVESMDVVVKEILNSCVKYRNFDCRLAGIYLARSARRGS